MSIRDRIRQWILLQRRAVGGGAATRVADPYEARVVEGRVPSLARARVHVVGSVEAGGVRRPGLFLLAQASERTARGGAGAVVVAAVGEAGLPGRAALGPGVRRRR